MTSDVTVGCAALSVYARAADCDDMKLAGVVGVNTATTEWAPAPNVVVAYAADPLATGTVVSVVVPSMKSTLPTAVAGLTFAVKVTVSPANAGDCGDAVIVVAVGRAEVIV